MPWQIPASHIPTIDDPVADPFDSQHWGTGGSCILGDPAIGSDASHVNATVLALPFPDAFTQYMGNTVADMFTRSEPFDITNPSTATFHCVAFHLVARRRRDDGHRHDHRQPGTVDQTEAECLHG